MSRGKQGVKARRVEENRAFQRQLRERKRERAANRAEQEARGIVQPSGTARIVAEHANAIVPQVFADEAAAIEQSTREFEEAWETAQKWKRSKKKGKTNIEANMRELGWEPDGEGGWRPVGT